MNTVRVLKTNFADTWKPFVGILLIVAAIMAVVFVLGAVYGVSVRDLTRDPAASTGYPAYLGFVSQLGILLWSASAAVCFLGYRVLSRQIAHDREPGLKRFLFCTGLITLMLGTDDAFMLHDRVFPHFNIHELIIYGSYAAAILAYIVIFRNVIASTEFLLLFAALGFFGLSLLTDLLYDPKYSPFWLEDGSKLVGVVSWFAYSFRTVYACLTGRLTLGLR